MTAADPTDLQGQEGEAKGASAPTKTMCLAALRIALIALASDHGIRGELSLLFGRRAELHLARVSAPDNYDLASLAATTQGIGRAIKRMGLSTAVDVAAYGCTSATVVVGEEVVNRSLAAALPGVPGTTPITATLAALAHLGPGASRCSPPIPRQSIARSPIISRAAAYRSSIRPVSASRSIARSPNTPPGPWARAFWRLTDAGRMRSSSPVPRYASPRR